MFFSRSSYKQFPIFLLLLFFPILGVAFLIKRDGTVLIGNIKKEEDKINVSLDLDSTGLLHLKNDSISILNSKIRLDNVLSITSLPKNQPGYQLGLDFFVRDKTYSLQADVSSEKLAYLQRQSMLSIKICHLDFHLAMQSTPTWRIFNCTMQITCESDLPTLVFTLSDSITSWNVSVLEEFAQYLPLELLVKNRNFCSQDDFDHIPADLLLAASLARRKDRYSYKPWGLPRYESAIRCRYSSELERTVRFITVTPDIQSNKYLMHATLFTEGHLYPLFAELSQADANQFYGEEKIQIIASDLMAKAVLYSYDSATIHLSCLVRPEISIAIYFALTGEKISLTLRSTQEMAVWSIRAPASFFSLHYENFCHPGNLNDLPKKLVVSRKLK